MNMFEEAKAMQGTLKLCRLTQKELGKRMGVSQSYVANKIRLLSLSEEEMRIINDAALSERHARCVLRLSDKNERIKILEKCINMNLTVRECEALVDTALIGNIKRDVACGEGQERIKSLTANIKQSIETLVSSGIHATERTSYYGNRMYITVCIDDI